MRRETVRSLSGWARESSGPSILCLPMKLIVHQAPRSRKGIKKKGANWTYRSTRVLTHLSDTCIHIYVQLEGNCTAVLVSRCGTINPFTTA